MLNLARLPRTQMKQSAHSMVLSEMLGKSIVVLAVCIGMEHVKTFIILIFIQSKFNQLLESLDISLILHSCLYVDAYIILGV